MKIVLFLSIFVFLSNACLENCCENLTPRPAMNFTYYQNTGSFIGGQGEYYINTFGYSGNGTGLNNPEKQCVMDLGPAPATTYKISYCKNWMHATHVNRPCSFALQPLNETEMCGRSDIFIHGCQCCTPGDLSIPPIGGCSLGCIVIPSFERQKLRVGDLIFVKHYEEELIE